MRQTKRCISCGHLRGEPCPMVERPACCFSTHCDRCQNIGKVYECDHWPGCDCPAGTQIEGCPGRTIDCPECEKVNSVA